MNYLANSKDKKLWEGECFVFDERVTVDKDLNKGSFINVCLQKTAFRERFRVNSLFCGVSCHQCINEKSEEDRLRYLERHKQIIKKQLINNGICTKILHFVVYRSSITLGLVLL